MIRYDEFSYLWPPRPEKAIVSNLLHTFERQGYVAQVKKNGTCSVIAVSPDKTITAMNRHNEVHKAWTPTPEVMRSFIDLPGRGWYVFVAELMHNKVPGIREVNYVHDVLVQDGEYLVGVTQEDRMNRLLDMFDDGDTTEAKTATGWTTHLVVNDNLWLPMEYESGFEQLYDGLTHEMDEGLVMKDPMSKLAFCFRQKSNVAGQIKCRRTHKNYSF